MPLDLAALGLTGSWDVVVLLAFVLIGIAYGIYAGRDRSVIILISTYVSLAVVTNAPAVSLLNRSLNVSSNKSLELVWFLGVFFAVFFVLWKSQILRDLSHDRGWWWESFLFSLFQVGLTISSALFLLPTSATTSLSPVFRQLFLGDEGRSVWLIAPIILLFALGRRPSYDDDDE
jgi:hypothetical protein